MKPPLTTALTCLLLICSHNFKASMAITHLNPFSSGRYCPHPNNGGIERPMLHVQLASIKIEAVCFKVLDLKLPFKI